MPSSRFDEFSAVRNNDTGAAWLPPPLPVRLSPAPYKAVSGGFDGVRWPYSRDLIAELLTIATAHSEKPPPKAPRKTFLDQNEIPRFQVLSPTIQDPRQTGRTPGYAGWSCRTPRRRRRPPGSPAAPCLSPPTTAERPWVEPDTPGTVRPKRRARSAGDAGHMTDPRSAPRSAPLW